MSDNHDQTSRHLPHPSSTRPRQPSPPFTSSLPSFTDHQGRTIVDDISSLPQRFADTGWGRPSFFQNILNQTENRHTRHSPIESSPEPISPPIVFDYSGSSRFHTLPRFDPSPPPVPAMTPRRSGFIDLTTTPSDMAPRTRAQTQDNNFKRDISSSPEAGPSTKRTRRNDGSSQDTTSTRRRSIPQIDLSQEADPVESTLKKQQTEALKAQAESGEKPLRMSNLTCIICLDTPKDLTVTACGHWFCHTCLMEALIVGERAGDGEARRSQCPVCRKSLSRQKANDTFPVLLMKGKPKRRTTEVK